MKKLLLILLILAACSEDEEDPRGGIGCLTAIDKNDPTETRVKIRCSTFQEFAAGGNVAAGGTSYWDSYKLHEWVKCDECN